MQFTARPFEPEDRDGFNRVRSRVYRTGELIPASENLIGEDATATVVEHDGVIVGAASALDFRCTLFDAELRAAAVAAVGVVPEFRRSGAGSALMEFSNRHLREAGYEAAVLYPFRGGYYRRFGYEYCGIKQKISVRPGTLKGIRADLAIRECSPEELGAFEPVYTAFARKFNGMNLRNGPQWQRALGMERPFTVYVAGHPAEAYAFVRLDGTFWVPQGIREFAWTSRRGYLSMLSFFQGFLMNKTEVSWWEPLNGPFLEEFYEQNLDCKTDGATMFRILDVEGCLRKLSPAGSGSISLKVIDPGIPENEGPWRVEFKDGDVSVERTDDAATVLTVGELAQLVFGWPGIDRMLSCGRIVLDPSSESDFKRFFQSRDVYCIDWF